MSTTASGTLCAICQSPINDGEAQTACPGCGAPYHAECWAENGGCAIYGCQHVPATEARAGLEIPAGYWGQEHKQCPVCGQEILAAALRCRHCGATFASARPEDGGAYRQREAATQGLPALKQGVVWIFALSIVPFTALIGGIAGVIWLARHRDDARKLPPFHAGLARLSPFVGFGQTAILIAMAALYAAVHHHR
jgi:predicted RNA-binding Zn-ribbon protein involved in translation (DUF1610 family)